MHCVRGHRDDSSVDPESNRGNFLALLDYNIESGNSALARHLQESSKNAIYTSKTIQNDLIDCIGSHIRDNILKERKEYKYLGERSEPHTWAGGVGGMVKKSGISKILSKHGSVRGVASHTEHAQYTIYLMDPLPVILLPAIKRVGVPCMIESFLCVVVVVCMQVGRSLWTTLTLISLLLVAVSKACLSLPAVRRACLPSYHLRLSPGRCPTLLWRTAWKRG